MMQDRTATGDRSQWRIFRLMGITGDRSQWRIFRLMGITGDRSPVADFSG